MKSKIRLLSLCRLLYESPDEAHPIPATQSISV